MRLRPGEQLLRLEMLTPGNFGSAAGTATVDRPTQKDAWLDLPFLPDSALKGVLAGRNGNAGEEDGKTNPRREPLYGSPDRAGESGRPGPLVFGNGDLLAFPFPAGDGRIAWVFPAPSVARALRLDPAAKPSLAALEILSAVEGSGTRTFAWPVLPKLRSVSLESLAGRPEGGPELAGLLRHYAGNGIAPAASLLVVPGAQAAFLWKKACEIRTQTAIDGETATVAPGSLRTVELVPQGTVFLSLVTWRKVDAEDVPMPDRIQVGAWENLGLGWVGLSLVEAAAAPAEQARESSPPVQGTPAEADVMIRIHQAVQSLRNEPQPLKEAIRSAVGNFGPRAQFSGLEAALAFELAKSKLGEREPKTEAQAHRWLLAALLTAKLQDWLGDKPFDSAKIELQRDLILTRWRWLRRATEFDLES